MSLSLVVLAAGKGSRFGGPKQLTAVGSHGETITHYNVYDALRAGFDRFVFIVREAIEAEFRSRMEPALEGRATVHFVCQDRLLPGQTLAPGLWGTTHALLHVQGLVSDDFAVINADDYYGPDTFAKLASFYASDRDRDCALIGYPVVKTLSTHGPVTRAWCEVDDRQRLMSLRELRGVRALGDSVVYESGTGAEQQQMPQAALVSMNCWGLRAGLLPEFAKSFDSFQASAVATGNKECLLPETMHALTTAGQTQVRVIETQSSWFGLTFSEDLPAAQKVVERLVAEGVYTSPLFGL